MNRDSAAAAPDDAQLLDSNCGTGRQRRYHAISLEQLFLVPVE